MADYQTTREFFARVFPWGVDGTGYLNLHWTSANFKGQAGRACASLDDAMRTLQWIETLPDVRDVYFCTSAQADYDHAKTKKPNSRAALRAAANAIRFRALCIDVDAKGEDKDSYPDLPTAVTAFGKFVADAGLPKPNVIVKSGGGLHIYWLAAEDMDYATWGPLAHAMAEATRQHGLKCDTQCTVDAARILRVPGTFNHKLEAPRPVEALKPMRDPYALDVLRRALEAYMGSVTLPPARAAMRAANDLNAELSAGISDRSVPPLNKAQVVEVMKGCAFLRNTFATHGRDHANPLWHQSVLMAGFMVDGRKLAHAFSSGHPSYTQEETDREFDRVERDIAERGLGWPSCRAIAGAGCGDCAACPHFAKGKSPLHLALALPPPPPPNNPPPNTPPGNGGAPLPPNWDLPEGYSRNGDGFVSVRLIKEDGTTIDKPLSLQPMFNPWLQANPRTLHFTTREKDGEHEVAVEVEAIYGMDGLKILGAQGVHHLPRDASLLKEFLVSWISHLQNAKSKVAATGAYGWEPDGKGGVAGFAYGGKLYRTDGTETTYVGRDPTFDERYRPSGDPQVWTTACEALITSQGTPTLEVLVAASFAAPLVDILGYTGLLLSGFSSASGIGKTTASYIGQAVWSSPLLTQTTLNDTSNSMMNKLGLLRSLPLYWDENRGADSTSRKFLDVLFRITQGTEKNRLTSRIKQQVAGTWSTLVISTSNDPLSDQVERAALTTEAGQVRLFELEMRRRAAGAPETSTTNSEVLKKQLNTNFGHAGAAYAAFLGKNRAQIEKEVRAKANALEKQLGMQDAERLWLATVTCLLMGATYANQLGLTKFHLAEIEDLLLTRYMELRAEVAIQTSRLDNPEVLQNIVARFMSTMQERTIHTDVFRPPGRRAEVRRLRPDQRISGVLVHIAVKDEKMRIAADPLNRWLDEQGISRRLFHKEAATHLGFTRAKTHLASGVPGFSTPKWTVYEVPLGDMGPGKGSNGLETLLEGFE